ncbi:winged helix-turn-helix domain-containing protein [Deinococcus hopiensis]|uniref:winged helix-turn-helix domain-containing protein n=1 Tax=Deinococcus hopiensis TaxID=309885 RepID=UPI000A023E59|nr:winged helix-turn-helix domain-containing protein [Deinococcus hopiensis]
MTVLRRLMWASTSLPCERKRYLALWHAHQGLSALQIEDLGLLSVSRLYQQGGLDALKERVQPGQQSRLTPGILADIRAQLASGERTWNSRTLAEYIAQKYDVTIGRTALRDQWRAAGMSWQRTRYVVAGQVDPEQKAAFRDDLEAVKKGR